MSFKGQQRYQSINVHINIEILDSFHILSIENWFGDEVIFHNDNASCYRVKGIKVFFNYMVSKQSRFKSNWKFVETILKNSPWEGAGKNQIYHKSFDIDACLFQNQVL